MKYSKGAMTREKGFQGQKWSILGEPYVPLHMTPSSLLLDAEFGPDSFVPTHIHETQDEILYILEGEMDFDMEGGTIKAGPGTTVTLPKGIPHSLHNRSGKLVKALVVVSPTGDFYDYMTKISGLTDPAEVVRLGPEHGIRFV